MTSVLAHVRSLGSSGTTATKNPNTARLIPQARLSIMAVSHRDWGLGIRDGDFNPQSLIPNPSLFAARKQSLQGVAC